MSNVKKEEYLSLLKEVLDQNDFNEEEAADILSDYEELYSGYLEREMDDAEIKKKLGSPFDVVAALKGSMKYTKKPETGGEKWVAVSPFVSLIAFFILGFLYDLWHPGWLVFLLIPVSAISLSFTQNAWGKITALSPFFATAFFMIYGYIEGVYHPTWMVFLLILLFAYLSMKEPRKYAYIASLLVGSAVYLWIGLAYGVYDYSLFAFLPLIILGIYFGEIKVEFFFPRPIGYIAIFAIFVYILSGYLFGLWGIMWLIFFLIPFSAVYLNGDGKSRYIGMTPFISFVIFFLLGYYLGIWHLSWMAFLLIPVTAILIGDEDTVVIKKDK